MVEYLSEKAAKYAAENKDKILQALITKVYAEGYWDGYNDHKNDVEMSRQDDKIHYVDLGLPSKTLWADKFVESGGLIKYIPYCDAELLSLPTAKQWDELITKCKWKQGINSFYCIGPNGKSIEFNKTGFKETSEGSEQTYSEDAFFWIKKTDESNSGRILNNPHSKSVCGYRINSFTGYKLPIRLVKSDNA